MTVTCSQCGHLWDDLPTESAATIAGRRHRGQTSNKHVITITVSTVRRNTSQKETRS